MSYLTKRIFALRPVLDKKKDIESAVTEVKQKQEHEQDKLDKIRAEFDSVDLALAETNEQLIEISEGCDDLAKETLNFISRALSSVSDSDVLLNKHLLAIKELNGVIIKQQQKLEKIKVDKEATMQALAVEDARLEIKRTDIKIYESRLRKKLKDSGMEDIIKLVF